MAGLPARRDRRGLQPDGLRGGSVEDLDACAERLGVVAIYVLAGGEWVPYIPGAPGFVNAAFRELFPDGVPAATPLTVGSAGT